VKGKTFVLVVASVAASIAVGAGAGAGAGPCTSGTPGCAADSNGGSQYQFGSSDSNLSNNFYDEGTPFPNNPVNNSVYQYRVRSSSVPRACGYYSTGGAGGTAGWGRWAVNGWSFAQNGAGASSYYLKTSDSC
jgi:hypothetical protein